MIVKRIKKTVKHQGIGGQEFIVDEYVTSTINNETVLNDSKVNMACLNFVIRRPDFNINFPHKLYYGKVGNLGYVVAEDEFIEEGE